MNVLFAKRLLERLGATVDVADNGREALGKLDAIRHQIVLMDIQMPVMDGYEATRLLRERGETLPIIALTADATPESAGQWRAAGLNDSLAKPFRPDMLVAVIQKYL